jgi:hypothetical protein
MLANQLKNWDIELIPITLDELITLKIDRRKVVFNFAPDLRSFYSYQSMLNRYLNFQLLNQNILLFDANSFHENPITHKLFRYKNYYFFRLPFKMTEIVTSLALVYLSEQKNLDTKWPGGRRAKLPGPAKAANG